MASWVVEIEMYTLGGFITELFYTDWTYIAIFSGRSYGYSMSMYYEDYIWKNGSPYGIRPRQDESGYKIPADPYKRYLSIERYNQGEFVECVYDSTLFNFKHLKPEKQIAWERVALDELSALLKDHNDCVKLREIYTFEKELCRECRIYSIHGPLVSIHKMYYSHLGDSFDGVILFDANEHMVLIKKYHFDQEAMCFTDLLEEVWEPKEASLV